MKNIVNVFLLLILSFSAVSQELIHTFEIGAGDGAHLGYHSPMIGATGSLGPTGIYFDQNGHLIICDVHNKLFKVYDKDYSLLNSFENQNEKMFFSVPIENYTVNISRVYDKVKLKNILVFEVTDNVANTYRIAIDDQMVPVFIPDSRLVILPQKNSSPQIIIYLKNSWVDNQINTLTVDESKRFLTLDLSAPSPVAGYTLAERAEILKDVRIDDQNRVFYKGILQSLSSEDLFNYWSELHGEVFFDSKQHPYDIGYEVSAKYTTDLVGNDIYDNYYFINDVGIQVHNSDGWIIYQYMFTDFSFKTTPAVHPSGDIYFLDYDSEGAYLYRIKNTWDPEGRAAWYAEHGGE